MSVDIKSQNLKFGPGLFGSPDSLSVLLLRNPSRRRAHSHTVQTDESKKNAAQQDSSKVTRNHSSRLALQLPSHLPEPQMSSTSRNLRPLRPSPSKLRPSCLVSRKPYTSKSYLFKGPIGFKASNLN